MIIPLDTHVAKMSRNLNLVNRSSNDWKTAEIITNNLKKFDASDPVKYDFALFGLGIENISLKTKFFPSAREAPSATKPATIFIS